MLPIFHNFVKFEKYFPSGVQLTVTILRNPDAIVLNSWSRTATYKIRLHDASMTFVRFMPAENMSSALTKTLSAGHFSLPMTRYISRAVHVHAGRYNTPEFVLVNGLKPAFVYIAFVKAHAYNGDPTENAFELINADVSTLTIKDGIKKYPSHEIKSNFGENLFTPQYHETLRVARRAFGRTPAISPKEFQSGCCIFA
jgi:hypothetical protein